MTVQFDSTRLVTLTESTKLALGFRVELELNVINFRCHFDKHKNTFSSQKLLIQFCLKWQFYSARKKRFNKYLWLRIVRMEMGSNLL